MSTATVTLTKVSAPLPAANAAFAGTVVTLTDSSGVAQAPVTLTGVESPPWTAVFLNVAAVAGSTGTVTAQDTDTAGASIGPQVSTTFTEIGSINSGSFQQTTAIRVAIS